MSSMASARRSFGRSEVAAHSTPGDCWVIIHGSVYDVTRFLAHHPGGVDALSKHGRAGCDVTDAF